MNVKEFMNELLSECGLHKMADSFILFDAVEPIEYLNLTVGGGYGFRKWLDGQHIFIQIVPMSGHSFYILLKDRIGPSIDSAFDIRTANLFELKNIIKNASKQIKEYRYKKKLDDIKKDFE